MHLHLPCHLSSAEAAERRQAGAEVADSTAAADRRILVEDLHSLADRRRPAEGEGGNNPVGAGRHSLAAGNLGWKECQYV